MLSGACMCGKIQYQIEGEPRFMLVFAELGPHVVGPRSTPCLLSIPAGPDIEVWDAPSQRVTRYGQVSRRFSLA
jgi:hypothetical protein